MRSKVVSSLALVAAFGVIHSAMAADLPTKAPMAAPIAAPPLPTWTGCHLGINVGAGWTSMSASTSVPTFGPTGANNTLLTIPFLGSPNWGTALSESDVGFVGGGQAGCDYQIGSVVFGIETDIQGNSAKAAKTTSFAPAGSPPATTVTNAFSHETPWFGTLRGRLGTTFFNPSILVYATGGFAYGREKVSDLMTVTAGPTLIEQFPFSTSSTRTGYTVGGGLEWMFAEHWQVRAEYLFVSLRANASQNLATAVLGPGAIAADAMQFNPGEDKLNIVRVGLDYKF